ncbi:MAG: tRNA (adenosine(37)-N6)-threonylcarbamoyltransferase complex ATPase subunit type 1 TsaE, partial [Bacillota bacterium]|nr:tRNA (adenosine(37)-N6)-threonylcarbamoyltransferase complex ATPase subunit type 1 TsaE [Bacillota bacterium]
MLKINSASTSETEEIGYKLAQKVSNTAVIALYGGLGMGKTAFTRGFARGLGVDDNIMSPTFAIVNEYIGITKIYHFDMYRIQSWED